MSGMIINTNFPAVNARRSLKNIGGKSSKAAARLSSGLRINSASDDAAGIAISEKMKAQIRGMKQAQQNVEDGINLIQVMDGAMDGMQEMMIRQRELIIQALNDTNTDSDRDKIQLEIDQLTAEIGAMAERTTFNTIPLLAGKDKEELAPVDVCFVIDVSGSMGSALANVKASIEDFMNQLPEKSRVGFVIYSDHLTIPSETMQTFSPSSDIASVKNFINGITLIWQSLKKSQEK